MISEDRFAVTGSIRIGVSACLLGERVRYDGGHKHNSVIIETLGRKFSLVPVCPEVECGFPVPREAMRLEGDAANPRLITIFSRIDLTDRMLAYCERKVGELLKEDLCGFIFKKDSPSSGLNKVRVFQNGSYNNNGIGLFAAAVARHFPLMPMEEEDRLVEPDTLEKFIKRVLNYRQLLETQG